jgi:hypothetical protein
MQMRPAVFCGMLPAFAATASANWRVPRSCSSERFGRRFDGAIVIAAARTSAPALDFYISRFRGRQVNDSVFLQTLL